MICHTANSEGFQYVVRGHMKSVWINGWGRSAEGTAEIVARYLPGEHVVIQPFKNWRAELEHHLTPSTSLYGYSLGAFLLLGTPGYASHARSAFLFAPFFDLKAESGGGGRVPEEDIRGLRLMLALSPEGAMQRFARKAELPPDAAAKSLPEEELAWGLEVLLRESRQLSAANDFYAWVGGNDPLLDTSPSSVLVQCAQVVRGADHSLASLLEFM